MLRAGLAGEDAPIRPVAIAAFIPARRTDKTPPAALAGRDATGLGVGDAEGVETGSEAG